MILFLKAVFLGIVEGITEFLPISSTGHLIVINNFIGFKGAFASMFDIVIQLGAVLSVVVYFWKDLYPFHKEKDAAGRLETWNIWKKTVVGVLPALAIGAAVGSKIEERLFNPYVVAMALVVGGAILIFIEKRKKTASINTVASLTYGTAVAIGFIQCIAMIPGTSRSAATILGAMALGASRSVAAEFSFFLAIPTMFAASGYSLMKTGAHLSLVEWQVLVVGFVVSFFVAWMVVSLFMSYIRKRNFIPFAYYRIVLGIVVLIYFMMMVPKVSS